ncbi:SAM-dependent methyltransferase [Campylobacter helveticus]|uniref:SAM-dependent methyltransferase n=1 Tax=Campylobacter helveticus TaxID=28898 RepID=UPI0011126C9A|nr:SAM-dependent methyltransferase [Campylobacter helveticus]TNB56956.1 SAM-dependent methyltransferase [Campylobacter helveticus]
MTEALHLNKQDKINLGSFYTTEFLIDEVYFMLQKYVDFKDFVLLDSSCGSGNFLCDNALIKNGITRDSFSKIIGVDIDKTAIDFARKRLDSSVILLHKNALCNVSRQGFHIPESSRLIVVGNPPYNDRTSIVQSALKNTESIMIDSALQARDIGISFLRSYEKLNADFICVLHPLSYLIKSANFQALKDFVKSYKLLDSIIISSQVFCQDSKGYFPIIIALYQKDKKGMDYDFIKNFNFQTIGGKNFRLNDFDFISNYIDKYPNKKRVASSQIKAMFYTMRDINALRRSKTFMNKENSNTIFVPQDKYSLYCYVDVFKKFLVHIPYYFGNCDVMIDYEKFKILESNFIKASESGVIDSKIKQYFKNLLGVHYENPKM